MVDQPNLSPSAMRALSTFCLLKQDLPWLMDYCSASGGLIEDMEQFLRSLGRLLRSEFALYGWHQSFEKSEEGVSLRMYPANWDLSVLGQVFLRFDWYNPFGSSPADRYLSVEVAAPREWRYWEELKHLLRAKLVPQGFTDVYEPGEPDPNGLFWTYVPFDQFISEPGVNIPKYVVAIKHAVHTLCQVRPAIDEFLANCPPAGAGNGGPASHRVS